MARPRRCRSGHGSDLLSLRLIRPATWRGARSRTESGPVMLLASFCANRLRGHQPDPPPASRIGLIESEPTTVACNRNICYLKDLRYAGLKQHGQPWLEPTRRRQFLIIGIIPNALGAGSREGKRCRVAAGPSWTRRSSPVISCPATAARAARRENAVLAPIRNFGSFFDFPAIFRGSMRIPGWPARAHHETLPSPHDTKACNA